MKRSVGRFALRSAAATAVFATLAVRAQEADSNPRPELGTIDRIVPSSMSASVEELRAFEEIQTGHHIKAREMAERILVAHPDSFVSEFILGYVNHYGEANFPRALYHLQRAREHFEARYGSTPPPTSPWQWHTRILMELAQAHGDLEQYEDQLEWMNRYNILYDPDVVAEMAWPLMKLRRFDAARQVAAKARLGASRDNEIALNAQCAIEFEAGNPEASYRACEEAMNLHGANPRYQSAVDFTNFAEAARSLFRLDEAERVDLLAVEAQTSWFGNPHVELAELYLREARFTEALAHLRKVPAYRARRPPYVQESDRSESRRALASFFLVIGRTGDALRLTERMVLAPDRRSHNSRDPQQDIAISAMLDRRAHALAGNDLRIEAIGKPIWERAIARGRSWLEHVRSWASARQVQRALNDDSRLVGAFMIGTARSAVLPPWMVGELIESVGPGVALTAIARAREEDGRAAADAYYDAFEAEAHAALGASDVALLRADSALAHLPQGEALLRARIHAIAAYAALDDGNARAAVESLDQAFQIDPGIAPRLDRAVPVRIDARGDLGEEVGELLAQSPLLEVGEVGLPLRIEANRAEGRACLWGSRGSVLGCAEERATANESGSEFAARLARGFHASAFAPRVNLSRADATSLDGSNTVSRGMGPSILGSDGDGTDVEQLDE